MLVGIPVAYVTRPWGLVLLLARSLVWAVCQFVYWLREKRHGTKPKPYPVFWQAEVTGVALLAVVLFVAPSVGSPDRVPQAVPVADLGGGEQDLAVAERFRPLLFFDSGERRFPLDVQDAIADDRVQICRKAVGDDNCALVESAELIDENQDYLELEEAPGTPRGGNDTSAVYYHVTRPEADGLVYVDYWWFYSRNPSPVADKVFCGPGLRTPPFTCQEHAGDWEGLTVVLAPCTDCEPVGDESLAPDGGPLRAARARGRLRLERGAGPALERSRRPAEPRRSPRPGATSCSRRSPTRATAQSPSSRGTAMPRTRARASEAASRRPATSRRPSTTARSPGRTTRSARSA